MSPRNRENNEVRLKKPLPRLHVAMVAGLSLLFLISVFKHISYPLLWNDEAETAEYGRRILKYGIPKIHDGYKMLFLWEQGPMEVGTKEPYDAYIISGWGQYYIAAMPAFFAVRVDDPYLKTAIMRLPFAAIGCAGLALLLFGILQAFDSRRKKFHAAWFFVLLCLLSISLTLHLREVRYYSPVIFLSSCVLFVYWRYVFFSRSYWLYAILVSVALLAILSFFYPVFLILIGTLGLHLLLYRGKNASRPYLGFVKGLARDEAPLVLSLVLCVPYFLFFETFKASASISQYWTFDNARYLANLKLFAGYFARYEFLYLAILMKLLSFWLKPKDKTTATPDSLLLKIRLSNFLWLYFGIYLLLIARSPQYFERYAIGLIPVLAGVTIIDLFTCLQRIDHGHAVRWPRKPVQLWGLFAVALLLTAFRQREHYAGHIYELREPFRGPMDYVVEYLRKTYPDTSQLVIATNYEEPVFMFYLDARVTLGFAQQTLAEDMKIQPDVILYRHGWWHPPQNYQLLMDRAAYRAVRLPVWNHMVNNLPELSFAIPHLYRTPAAWNPSDQLVLFVKE